MYLDHETGKKKTLEAVGKQPAVETDEQLARRLHEELNALTRHARRSANVPAVGNASMQRSTAKSAKPAAADVKGQGKLKQQQKQQHSHPDVKQEAECADAAEQLVFKADRPKKRSMLNRELAMLVTDMVEAHVKPTTGLRLKAKDEQDQQDQRQQHYYDSNSTADKHDSSSSLSEQERLAIEHLHAAGTVTKPVNKLLEAPHLAARTSDSGGPAGDSCMTGATSSGKACSSSHGDEQQQTSGRQQLLQLSSKQGSGRVHNADFTAAGRRGHAGTAECTGSNVKPIKIPKLPMVQFGKKWYRAKVLKDAGSKVMLEYQGYSHEGGPFWLVKDHPRIWRGSYKGRDWRYLGDGAWEPKPGKNDAKSRAHRRGAHKHSSAAAAAAADVISDGTGADSDAEQAQVHRRSKAGAAGKRTAVALAAAGAVSDGAVSERDTAESDQEDQADGADEDADTHAEPLTVDSPAVAEATHERQQEGTAAEQQLPQGPVQQQEQQMELQSPETCKQQKGVEQQVVAEPQMPAFEPKADQQSIYAVQEQESHQEQLLLEQQRQQQSAGELQQQAAHKEVNQQQQPEHQPVHEQQQQMSEPSAVSQRKQQVHHRRRRQSDVGDGTAVSKLAAMEESVASKLTRKVMVKTASEQALAAVVATATSTTAAAATAAAAAAVIAAVAPAAAPGDSSSERRLDEAAAAAAARLEAASDRAEEAMSAPVRAGNTGRGRYSRKNKAAAAASVSADANSTRHGSKPEGVAKPKRGSRGGRSRSGAAAVSQDSGRREKEPQRAQVQEQQRQQQQQPSCCQGPGLHVEAGKAMKQSSSSEGLPISPTSPIAGSGGSPRAHRRKGKPQRARLDSDDLQRPAKKVRGANSCMSGSRSLGRSNSDAIDAFEHPMLHELPELQAVEQPQPQPLQEEQQQQQESQTCRTASLGFKGAWKGAYKKGIWQIQSQQHEQQDQASSYQTGEQCPQKGAVVQQQQQHECRQQHQLAAVSVAGESQMHAEQIPVLGGSDPEDVEAACVLVGASVGRAHSGEVFGVCNPMQQYSSRAMQDVSHGASYSSHHHHHYSHRYPAAADESQLSPRALGGRQNSRRRGHNWSKPLNRPPRPPAQQQQQPGLQHAHSLVRRASLNGNNLQQQQYQQGMYDAAAAAELQRAHSLGQELPVLASPRFSSQTTLQDPAFHNQHQLRRRSSACLMLNGDSDSKAATLRTLLDAVGEIQATSGRPDLMYPLQYGGLPAGMNNCAAARPCGSALQHLHMSAAAAALLAAVPSLESLHRMASLQGQAGLAACLHGSAPSLFQ